MSGKKNSHIGHRDRLRKRFIQEGLEHFELHNILELLLFYSIPQKDTNEIAHALIDQFGNLHGVFSADMSELVKVNGIGLNSARLIRTVSYMMDAYLIDSARGSLVKGHDNILKYAAEWVSEYDHEILAVAAVDYKESMISFNLLSDKCDGPLQKRDLFDILLASNATSSVIVRYCPTGKIRFTRKDCDIASSASEALGSIGIIFFDYVLVGSSGKFLSMKKDKTGLYNPFFK